MLPKEAESQIKLYVAITSASAPPGETKIKIAYLHLNAEYCFASRHTKHTQSMLNYI